MQCGTKCTRVRVDYRKARAHLHGGVLVVIVEAEKVSDRPVRDRGVAEATHGLERVLNHLFCWRSLYIPSGPIFQVWHVLVVVCTVVLMSKSAKEDEGNIRPGDHKQRGGDVQLEETSDVRRRARKDHTLQNSDPTELETNPNTKRRRT